MFKVCAAIDIHLSATTSPQYDAGSFAICIKLMPGISWPDFSPLLPSIIVVLSEMEYFLPFGSTHTELLNFMPLNVIFANTKIKLTYRMVLTPG